MPWRRLQRGQPLQRSTERVVLVSLWGKRSTTNADCVCAGSSPIDPSFWSLAFSANYSSLERAHKRWRKPSGPLSGLQIGRAGLSCLGVDTVLSNVYVLNAAECSFGSLNFPTNTSTEVPESSEGKTATLRKSFSFSLMSATDASPLPPSIFSQLAQATPSRTSRVCSSPRQWTKRNLNAIYVNISFVFSFCDSS